jgi:AmmeMemoRadiSam system protein A
MKLTKLARNTIEYSFQNKTFFPDEKTKKLYGKKQACFVTLTKNNELRGCIGSLIATKELYRDVMQNALSAAFRDPRFLPLKESELKEIEIEVSVLSNSEKIEFSSPEELLEKINKNMGIILKKGFFTSTFLPQVWEQLSDKINFLESLSMKAGLERDAWKTADIYYYTVRCEKE